MSWYWGEGSAASKIRAWWDGLGPVAREVAGLWIAILFACLLAGVSLSYGWAVGGLVAGAFGALAIRAVFVVALESLRPASKANRRLAARVESAVAQHDLAQAGEDAP